MQVQRDPLLDRAPAGQPTTSPHVRVLMVEDSRDDEVLVTRLLRLHGAPVVIERTESAHGLRDALLRDRWDVVISDFNMPAFTGLQALAQVRDHDANLPFIMVSATIGEAAAVEAMRAGASDYVMKDNLSRLLPAFERELRAAGARRRSAERLEFLARYDPSTRLANRALFIERLARFSAAGPAVGCRMGIVVIDVDKLECVNDSMGREVHDAIIGQVAERLSRRVGDDSRIARIASDRFAFVTTDLGSDAAIAACVEDLVRSVFTAPFDCGETDVAIAAHAGIARFPGDGETPDMLLRNADAAATRACTLGEPCLFYAEQMTTRIAEQLVMESRLRKALARGEFRLYYQPKVDLASRSICAVEALLRWDSPDLGLVMPGRFIPMLESSGLILEVGSWALQQAVRDHEHWRAQELESPRIAVNVSVAQLHRGDLVDAVRSALGQVPGPPGIDIEVTESVLMGDSAESIRTLAAVRALGVNIAIDDFGTGYSSLGYLAKLPLNALKIDRSFVAAMLADQGSMTLVSTIVALAHSLELVVVAEGVETEAQAQALRSMGCDQLQGYLHGRPVSRDEMTSILRRENDFAAAA